MSIHYFFSFFLNYYNSWHWVAFFLFWLEHSMAEIRLLLLGAHFCFGCFILCSLNRRKHSFSDFLFRSQFKWDDGSQLLRHRSMHSWSALRWLFVVRFVNFSFKKTQDPSLIAIRSLTTLTHWAERARCAPIAAPSSYINRLTMFVLYRIFKWWLSTVVKM